MELLIHIGMNKCASSFIQDVAFKDKKILRSAGIHYHDPRDFAPWTGDLTRRCGGGGGSLGGNGRALAYLLGHRNDSGLRSYLERIRRDGEKYSAKAIFISNENIFKHIVNNHSVSSLKSPAKHSGFSRVRILACFREVASHAISAYNHRGHRLPRFEKWARSKQCDKSKVGIDCHEYWLLVENFIKILSTDPDIQVESADVSGGALRVMKNFLGVQDISDNGVGRSNTSMNCVESELLRFLSKSKIKFDRSIRDGFKNLPKELKSSDEYIRHPREQLVRHFMVESHLDVATKLAELVESPGFVTMPEKDVDHLDLSTEFRLSSAQMEILSSAIRAS